MTQEGKLRQKGPPFSSFLLLSPPLSSSWFLVLGLSSVVDARIIARQPETSPFSRDTEGGRQDFFLRRGGVGGGVVGGGRSGRGGSP